MYGDEKRAETIISTAVFAALITVGGWLSIPLFAVPFHSPDALCNSCSGLHEGTLCSSCSALRCSRAFRTSCFPQRCSRNWSSLWSNGRFYFGIYTCCIDCRISFRKKNVLRSSNFCNPYHRYMWNGMVHDNSRHFFCFGIYCMCSAVYPRRHLKRCGSRCRIKKTFEDYA